MENKIISDADLLSYAKAKTYKDDKDETEDADDVIASKKCTNPKKQLTAKEKREKQYKDFLNLMQQHSSVN